jgi:hypothetical protein
MDGYDTVHLKVVSRTVLYTQAALEGFEEALLRSVTLLPFVFLVVYRRVLVWYLSHPAAGAAGAAAWHPLLQGFCFQAAEQ